MAGERKLVQKKALIGTKTFELLNEKQLSVKFKGILDSSEVTVDLFDLDSKTERIVYKEPKWIVVGVIFLMLPVAAILEMLSKPIDTGMIIFSFFFTIPSAVCFHQYFKKSYDMIIFKYFNNGKDALYFWNNRPNNDQFNAFINQLMSAIDKLKINPRLSTQQKIEIYTQHLQFLCNESVLSETEAEQLINRTQKRLRVAGEHENVISIVRGSRD